MRCLLRLLLCPLHSPCYQSLVMHARPTSYTGVCMGGNPAAAAAAAAAANHRHHRHRPSPPETPPPRQKCKPFWTYGYMDEDASDPTRPNYKGCQAGKVRGMRGRNACLYAACKRGGADWGYKVCNTHYEGRWGWDSKLWHHINGYCTCGPLKPAKPCGYVGPRYVHGQGWGFSGDLFCSCCPVAVSDSSTDLQLQGQGVSHYHKGK